MTNSLRVSWGAVFGTLALCLFPLSARAGDVTIFGGVQPQGQLTLQSAPGSASNFVQTFNPRTFGVFGVRLSGGKVIGGEHTIAYAPNFIQGGSHAFILHSNLLVQAPLPVVKPYGTVGLGIIRSGGNSTAAFGSKLAFNYGGGAKVMAGPLGVSLDVRGYTIPRFSIKGFSVQQRLNFIQVSAGLVFSF